MQRAVWLSTLWLAGAGCFSDVGNPNGAGSGQEGTAGAPTSGSSSGVDASLTAAETTAGQEGSGTAASTTDPPAPASCGDGRVQAPEECDDGNERDQDGCDSNCTTSTGIRDVAVGSNHSCALRFNGSVRCWGSMALGVLGQGGALVENIGDDEFPAAIGDVPLQSGVEALESGLNHLCALYASGGVRCWGSAGQGRLGYGNLEAIGDNETANAGGEVEIGGPVAVVGLAGDHTCAVLTSGSLRCWGRSDSGRLGYGLGTGEMWHIGDDETPSSAGNVPLANIDVATVAGRNLNTCVSFANGAVRCWGDDSNGQLGALVGTTIGDDEPAADGTDVDLGGATATKVTLGAAHACALTDNGRVYCWGSGSAGQLGYASIDNIGDDETPGTMGPVVLGKR